MKFSSMAIAILIFSAVVIGFGSTYSSLNEVYDYNIGNYSNASSFQPFNDSFSEINVISRDLQNHTAGISSKSLVDISLYQDIVLAFIDVTGILSRLPNIMIEFINQGFSLVGINVPWWVSALIFAIISLVIAFKAAAIVLKREDL